MTNLKFSVKMSNADLNQFLLENDDEHPDYWEALREEERRAEYYHLQQWDNAPELDFPLSYSQ